MNNNELRGNATAMTYVIFLVGILFLSFTAPWQKLSNFDPATGAFTRCLIGVICLLPFAIMEAKKIGALSKKGVLLSLLAGLVLGIDFTAWNYSIYFVGSGIASILLNIQVIMLPALAFFVDREKIPFSYYFIAPIMLAGVILAGGALENGIVDPNGPQEVFGLGIMAVGTICGLTSGFCYGIYLFASRRAGRIGNGQVVQPIFLSSFAQLVAPLVWAFLITGQGFDFTNGVMVDTAGGIKAMHLSAEMGNITSILSSVTIGDPINTSNWFWMVVLGVAGQAAAWTFTQHGSIKLNPTLGAGLLILSPIATVALIAPIMFGESLSALQIFGAVIALLAVAYQNGLFNALLGKNK
ncbi:DMT family transporter [Helicobacter burdigaliensis]|uniref:DMT family transporter n=1 Tax=Helicobacter burdigaliensis TaxID=2315334 RepID=UPI000EF64061|nr:DMT family transporter [Helicobacter burdigaliensis]